MKYLSKRQIIESLSKLANLNQFIGLTFLSAKKANLPIGVFADISLDGINNEFLKEYYHLDPRSKYYFRVFRYNNADLCWLRSDYASSGLQKMNTTTFKDAFIHTKDTRKWGWSKNYCQVLANIIGVNNKIPLYHLAVWIYRDKAWLDNQTRKTIIKEFISDYKITKDEIESIFTLGVETTLNENDAFQPIPVVWKEIEAEYCPPPDIGPEKSGILTYLELNGIGPVSPLRFDPGRRLNIITGDNGLGKTFILEVAWWALTGRWAGRQAYPNDISKKTQIKYQISSDTLGKPLISEYSPNDKLWPAALKRPTISGLIVYARVDGSFALWDPAGNSTTTDDKSILLFDRDQIWDGKPGRMEGLVRDWTKWQDKPNKYPFDIFKRVLELLSPPELGILKPGEPIRLPLDPREMPTVKHNYGDVPIVFESAGVRRIITLAYLIVWAWSEHRILSEQTNRTVENRMVILVDEIEAHLHPRWQRSILPALLKISEVLSADLEIQLVVATHSPLVLASAETIFDEATDKLYHLETSQSGKVTFSQLPFLKYGPVDSWLTSDIFDLVQARSRESEAVLKRAIEIQKEKKPKATEIVKIHELLKDHLSAEDRFWPRWVFFAQKYGVKI